MDGKIMVQYVGFQAKALVREYSFIVRDAADSREFTLTIPNEAFASHRARFQDGPDICSIRLHRELEACAELSSHSHFRVTEAELVDYGESHLPKAVRNLYKPKVTREF